MAFASPIVSRRRYNSRLTRASLVLICCCWSTLLSAGGLPDLDSMPEDCGCLPGPTAAQVIGEFVADRTEKLERDTAKAWFLLQRLVGEDEYEEDVENGVTGPRG